MYTLIKDWTFFIVIRLLIVILYCLPVKISRKLCGKLGEFIGIKLKKRWLIGITNLTIALPKIKHYDLILNTMWYNLGYMFADMIYFSRLNDEEFLQHVDIQLYTSLPPKAIFVAGHFSNWEIAIRVLKILDVNCCFMYRSLNNQFIDNFLKKLRYRYSKLLFRKEKGEIKSAIKLFLQGYSIGMLIDQKHLQGDMINFFNIPAPTLMLPAKLAIEHNVPIIFITIVRIHHKYIIKFIHINPTDQPEQMMLQVNHELEKLITQHPQQWLWIHKRWSDDVYKDQ